MDNTSDEIVKKIHQIFSILSKTKNNLNNEEILKYIGYCNRNIHLLNKALLKTDINFGLKTKLQTNIGHLRKYRLLLKSLDNVHLGGELEENKKVKLTPKRSQRIRWEDGKSAFSRRIRSGLIINLLHTDPQEFLRDSFYLFKPRIINELKTHPSIKVNGIFCCEFIKENIDENKQVSQFKYFNTKNALVDLGTNLLNWYHTNITEKVMNKLTEFQEGQSGLTLNRIESLEVNMNKYDFSNGGTSYIDLPKEIKLKKAVVNIRNVADQFCFAYAIVSCLCPADKNSDRLSSYPDFQTILNFTGISFPVSIDQISKFEALNNISVNVFTLKLNGTKYSVVPARITKQKRLKHVNLLLIQNKYFPENNYSSKVDNRKPFEITYHYTWIKNLSRLISSQLTKGEKKKYICDMCLNYFLSQEKLDKHTIDCLKFKSCKISFPEEKYLCFKNFKYKEPVPFIIYCDFEALLTSVNNSGEGKTERYQKHEAFAVGYYFNCTYDKSLSYYRSYVGLDCVEWFENELQNIEKFVHSKLNIVVPLENNQAEIGNANRCHICTKPFEENDIPVRDHSHFTGEFRGFAHSNCNLNYKNTFMVPVVFHNLSSYDSHLLIRDIAQLSPGNITLLAKNKEQYISFTKHILNSPIKYRFIDSFRFLASSLAKLASLTKIEDLKILKQELSQLNDSSFELLTRKGVYPYDYVSSMEVLKETQLPSIDKFYSKLNDEDISEDDYNHAQIVWNTFKITNISEYTQLYLKTDVLLLADIFENFRTSSLNTYGLDPGHYFTLPGYTWDCMLKCTNVKLEFLQDVDVLLFLENGIRGGISQCCNRYAKANNKYMSNFDSNSVSNYLMYFDVNGLYAWAMSQYLPYGEFEWAEDVNNFDVQSVPDNSPSGYILEVDLKYPERLHDLHKDLPMCPEHRVPPNAKLPKLMTTLYDKTRYILHYRNLKQCLESGLELKKIHRILQFKQSPWMKEYVDLNTSLRQRTNNEFEKNLFKLMLNAVFGKTMENIRKHRNVKLVTSWEGRYGANNYISSPNFHSSLIFGENLVAVELNKTEIVFNKPLYVGMCILDISKTCVYDFHLNFMLKEFDLEKCKLLYTDTDSLIYDVQCKDFYQIIKENLSKFYTSDYKLDDIPQVNKKVIGLMKDENNGTIMTEFVGLRTKMYSIKCEGICNVKKVKGLKKNVIQKSIQFEDYLTCLREFKNVYRTQRLIQSYLHDIYSIKQLKLALSPFDDKRVLREDSTDTLPHGHYSTLE